MAGSIDDISARVRGCAVQIIQEDGGGTGFFIAPRLVVTCAHVLFDDGQPVPSRIQSHGQSALVDFRSVLHAMDDDIALIATAWAQDVYLPIDDDLRVGDRVYAWGFADDYPQGDSVTLEYEGPTRAQRPLLKFKDGQVRPGMSGAPLLSQRTGAVCGIITLTRDRRTSLGGRAIPVATLYSLIPVGPTSHGLSTPSNYSWQQISSRLALFRDELRTRRASGSTRLTIANLLGPDGLLMPFRAKQVVGVTKEIFNPIERLKDDEANRRSMMILAPPGVGKSTLTYAMMTELCEPFLDRDVRSDIATRPIPFLIDLRDYREDAASRDFGSREWLQKRLDEVVGAPNLFRWLGISTDGADRASADAAPAHATSAHAYIILDSLDELLAGLSTQQISVLMSRFIFKRADTICCRTQFYERYLSTATSFDNRDIAELQLPADHDLSAYFHGYYRTCFPAMAQALSSAFQRRLEASAEFVAVCRIPLRLNMALDLLSPSADDIPSQPDLLGLYHAYLTGLLRFEAARHGSVLSAERKLRLLEELAWCFYDEGNMVTTDALPFTDLEFDRFIAKGLPGRRPEYQAEVAEDLRNRSVLHVDGGMFSSIRPGTMSFVHKSFQEYLIARWLYDSMSTSSEQTAIALRHYMSPEVDEFVKEFLRRTRVTPRLLSEIAQNCMKALRKNKRVQADPDQGVRARMACEQLGYFLGNISLPAVTEFLGRQLVEETDPWLRRGITCGLAVGGNEQYLHAYVDALRAERTGPLPHVQNDVNLGFQLSFCGDQPFEPLSPEQDQGLPACGRTIQQLVYQLGTEVDRGSWRLNLFTIIDLWINRTVSRASCEQVLRELTPTLRRIRKALSEDDRCSWWPEIDELANLVDAFDCQPGSTQRG